MWQSLSGLAGTVFDPTLLYTWGWRLILGLGVTAQVVLLSCSVGFVLAYPICRARMSRNIVLNKLALCYITIFRGTPLLCQLYLIYYGAGEIRPFLSSMDVWWFFREAFYCCVLAFTMNTAAYQAEIMRGALASVDKGQIEAATALGLSRYRIARHVVWPQAMLVALRPFGNELIGIVKASALAAIVTLLDLFGQTRYVFARTFDFSIYIYCAIVYLLITEAIRRGCNAIERALSRHKMLDLRLAPEALAPPRRPGLVTAPRAAPSQGRASL